MIDKDKLVKYLDDNFSYVYIGKQYGVCDKTVANWARKFGLYKPKYKMVYRIGLKKEDKNCKNCGKKLEDNNYDKKQIKYCSKTCQRKKEYKEYVDRWKQGNENGLKGKFSTSMHIRRYLFEKYNSKCCKCGWDKINPITKNHPLEIDHKDGNWLNNKEDNLELLCPNCHSLTPTYKNLNKGKGRIGRK